MKYIFLLLLFLPIHLLANDGAYYGNGNQLIPIIETEIEVQKEILTITKVDDYFKVDVYYEFYNPSEPKTILVGFEADAPQGDVNATPIDGKHPNMRNFKVLMNGEQLKYDIKYVNDSAYYKNGKFISTPFKDAEKEMNSQHGPYNYVYHFNAHFGKGLNIVHHTYEYDYSNGIFSSCDFTYVLTAANRWANKQIDDFTLIIDFGAFTEIILPKTFWKNDSNWEINGLLEQNFSPDLERVFKNNKFYIATSFDGKLMFKKNNFQPNGELEFYALDQYALQMAVTMDTFNCDKQRLPLAIALVENIIPIENSYSHKILRNLPYARRGCIFDAEGLIEYYESLKWYKPDNNYSASIESLTKREQTWLKKFEEH